jgi:hypothetical protein
MRLGCFFEISAIQREGAMKGLHQRGKGAADVISSERGNWLMSLAFAS